MIAALAVIMVFGLVDGLCLGAALTGLVALVTLCHVPLLVVLCGSPAALWGAAWAAWQLTAVVWAHATFEGEDYGDSVAAELPAAVRAHPLQHLPSARGLRLAA